MKRKKKKRSTRCQTPIKIILIGLASSAELSSVAMQNPDYTWHRISKTYLAKEVPPTRFAPLPFFFFSFFN